MSKELLNRKLIEARLLLENLSESNPNSDNFNFSLTMRVKALFFIDKNVRCTPSILMAGLKVVKSNLALLCKSMVQDGLINAEKNESDKRNIFYTITEKGKQELEKYFNFMKDKQKQLFSDKDLKQLDKKLDDLLFVLNKSKQ